MHLNGYVNILPEIEAPGHSLAAIASYPYLSSNRIEIQSGSRSQFYAIEDNHSVLAGSLLLNIWKRFSLK